LSLLRKLILFKLKSKIKKIIENETEKTKKLTYKKEGFHNIKI